MTPAQLRAGAEAARHVGRDLDKMTDKMMADFTGADEADNGDVNIILHGYMALAMAAAGVANIMDAMADAASSDPLAAQGTSPANANADDPEQPQG